VGGQRREARYSLGQRRTRGGRGRGPLSSTISFMLLFSYRCMKVIVIVWSVIRIMSPHHIIW
jgi:hypothetical protein